MTRQITIELDAAGHGSVMIDGDIIDGVRSVMLTAGVGQLTEVGLELVGADVQAQVEGSVKLQPYRPPTKDRSAGRRWISRAIRKDGAEVVCYTDEEIFEWRTGLWDRNAVGYDPRQSMV